MENWITCTFIKIHMGTVVYQSIVNIPPQYIKVHYCVAENSLQQIHSYLV